MTPRYHPRGRRPKLETFRAGHVFFMPKGATWLNRDKPRPFVLATSSNPARLGAFVYGSTQATEVFATAAFARVMPVLSGVNANGLLAPTYFYPGLMLPIPYQQLPSHAGTLAGNMAEFQQAVAQALGIGTGTCAHRFAPRGSARGRIVQFDGEFAEEVQTSYGVILTEHGYSRQRRYQLVVPIIRGDGLQADPSVLRVSEQAWLRIFPEPTTTALLAATVIQSVWHRYDIVEETPFVIDDESLEALEERLRVIFGIEVAPTE